MMTSNTETAAHQPEASDDPGYLERMGGLALAQQGRAMADIAADRCLLRRQFKANQNRYFGLPQDDLPECEEDMGVQVGDNTTTDNSKVIHNHYHGPGPTDPDPGSPCPPSNGRRPWWMIPFLVLPWVALATLLVLWILHNWPSPAPPVTPEPGPDQPILWEMDINAVNPPEPEPKTEPKSEPVDQPAGETE